MKYVIADVLGNFGEYKNIIVPTTGRREDTALILDIIIGSRYNDIVLTWKEWGGKEE